METADFSGRSIAEERRIGHPHPRGAHHAAELCAGAANPSCLSSIQPFAGYQPVCWLQSSHAPVGVGGTRLTASVAGKRRQASVLRRV